MALLGLGDEVLEHQRVAPCLRFFRVADSLIFIIFGIDEKDGADAVRPQGCRHIALGQLLVKLTAPGVPDIYQGDELEDLSLVDPDNRRPVDWDARRAALAALRAGAPPTQETEKLFVTATTLALRGERPDVFAGAYEPLDLGAGVCAYMRGGDVLVAVATRADAAVRLPAGWRDLLGLPGIALGVRV